MRMINPKFSKAIITGHREGGKESNSRGEKHGSPSASIRN